MKQSFLKSFCIFTLAITIAFFPLLQAQAFLGVGDVVIDPTHVAVSKGKWVVDKIFQGVEMATSKLSLASLGLPGSGAARGVVIKTADGACEITKKGLSAIEAADNFGTIDVIAGSAGTLAKLTAKISILTAVKNCKEATLNAASTPSISIVENVVRSGDMAKLAIDIANLEARIDKLKETRSEVNVQIWKGVAMRILLNAQSRLTTRLVNNLVSKYKIGNVLQYVDAASTFIYTKDYIQNNFKDDEDKMIIRSILTNDAFSNKVLPAIRSKASRTLSYIPDELDIADPDYYIKLAQAGTGEADPYLLQTVFEDQAAKAKANGDEAAKNEANSGEGFVPVRNCAGAVAQQNDIDRKNIQYSYDVRDREEALEKLKARRTADINSVEPTEIAQAMKDLAEARTKLQKMPEAVGGPIVKLCDAIQNPGASIAKSINGYLTTSLGNASNVKSENLPFFANFLESVATNFVGSIIEGQKPGLNILTDAGFKAVNIATTQFLENTADTRKLKDVETKTNTDSLVFTIEKTENGASEYKITWNADNIDGIVLMQITGPRNYKVNLPSPAGVMAAVFTTGAGGNYTFTAYDKNSQVLATKTFNLQLTNTPGAVTVPTGATVNEVGNEIDGTVKPAPKVTREDIIQDCMNNDKPRDLCEEEITVPPPTTTTPQQLVCGGLYPSRDACNAAKGVVFCAPLCQVVLGASISLPKEPIRGWKKVSSVVTPRGGSW
jgi:hypothetical protein